MKKGRNGILVLVLLLAVGFAAVTTTLVINGTTLFGTNSSEFDVIFTKAIVDGEDKSDTAIVEDGTKITYTTKELAIVDETSLLEFIVKNNSTQYDAEVSIECSGGSNAGTYYEIEKNVATRIAAQTEEEGTVRVKMIKSSVNEIEEEFTCTITATAVERDAAAEVVPTEPETVITYSDEDSSGTKNIGDIVTISKEGASSESFYILNADDTNIQMMSMYNVSSTTYLQSSSAETVAFSDSNGWADGEDIVIQNYDGSVKTIVNEYSTYLSETLGVENTATLITKGELEAIKGDGSTLSAAQDLSTLGYPSFLYSTSYWTRSANNSSFIWFVRSDGYFYYGNYINDGTFGVRPVVTINASLLN